MKEVDLSSITAAREARKAAKAKRVANRDQRRRANRIRCGGGANVSSAASNAEMKQNAEDETILHVAVVGFGWYAKRAHLPAFRSLEAKGAHGVRVKVTAVCIRTREGEELQEEEKRVASLLSVAQKRLGHAVVRLRSLEEVLECPSSRGHQKDGGNSADDGNSRVVVDVVDLLLPAPEMAAAVRQCLHAGKHVISEKPAAISVVEGKWLFSEWRRTAAAAAATIRSVSNSLEPVVSWSVCEQWGHKPCVRRLRELLYTMGVLEDQHTHVSPNQKLRKEWFHAGIVRFEFQHTQYMVEKAPTMDHKAPQQSSTDWRRNWRQRGRQAYTEEKGTWLLDVGVHYVRALRCLFGSSVRRVTSIQRNDASAHVSLEKVCCDFSAYACEVTDATIEFDSGITGTFRACFCSCSDPPLHHRGIGDFTASPSSGWCPELRIFGENGRILEWSFSAHRIRLLKIEETAPNCNGVGECCCDGDRPEGLETNSSHQFGARWAQKDRGCTILLDEEVRADSFVDGGVKAALADALHRAAVYQGLSRAVSFSGIGDIAGGTVRNCYTAPYPDGSNKTFSEPNHETLYKSELGTTGNKVIHGPAATSADSALRDVAVVEALLRVNGMGNTKGQSSAPPVQVRMKETFEIDPSASLHGRDFLSPSPVMVDDSNSWAWCPRLTLKSSSVKELQDAVQWARDRSMSVQQHDSSKVTAITGQSQSENTAQQLWKQQPCPLCQVRAVGCNHSWRRYLSGIGGSSPASAPSSSSPILSGVLCVEMLGMDTGGISFHATKGSKESADVCTDTVVRCGAGELLSDLVRACRRRGLSLVSSLPLLLGQTVRGAVSTGSHSSLLFTKGKQTATHDRTPITTQNIDDGNSGIGGSGDYDDNDEISTASISSELLMRALRVSLGSFGIIVSLELRCRPLQFVYRRTVLELPASDIIAEWKNYQGRGQCSDKPAWGTNTPLTPTPQSPQVEEDLRKKSRDINISSVTKAPNLLLHLRGASYAMAQWAIGHERLSICLLDAAGIPSEQEEGSVIADSPTFSAQSHSFDPPQPYDGSNFYCSPPAPSFKAPGACEPNRHFHRARSAPLLGVLGSTDARGMKVGIVKNDEEGRRNDSDYKNDRDNESEIEDDLTCLSLQYTFPLHYLGRVLECLQSALREDDTFSASKLHGRVSSSNFYAGRNARSSDLTAL